MMSTAEPPARPAARLYLVLPPITDAAGLPIDFGSALAAAKVAAVLMPFASADERTLVNRVKAWAPAIQDAGAALLLDGHIDIVGRTGADGAHLTGVAELKEALPRLKPERIAGAGGLASRHDAMTAAEAGADYVMFGEPDRRGARPALDALLERLRWWSEVFEVPCVGYAANLGEVGPLGAAGADFVALAPAVVQDPRGLAATLDDAATRLSARVPA